MRMDSHAQAPRRGQNWGGGLPSASFAPLTLKGCRIGIQISISAESKQQAKHGEGRARERGGRLGRKSGHCAHKAKRVHTGPGEEEMRKGALAHAGLHTHKESV